MVSIIILWDHCRICGPSLTETSLCGAYLSVCIYVRIFIHFFMSAISQVFPKLVITASSFVAATIPLWTVWQVLCFWIFAFWIRYVLEACAALSSSIIITTFLTLYTTASAPVFSSVCIRRLCPILKRAGQINPWIWSACVGKSVAVPMYYCISHTVLYETARVPCVSFTVYSLISFIPLACAECDDSLLSSGASSIPLCYVLFPATLLHQLFFHRLWPHLAIYFLVYLSVSFPNSCACIIPFWEFYFLPFSVHAQNNVIYLTLLSLL